MPAGEAGQVAAPPGAAVVAEDAVGVVAAPAGDVVDAEHVAASAGGAVAEDAAALAGVEAPEHVRPVARERAACAASGLAPERESVSAAAVVAEAARALAAVGHEPWQVGLVLDGAAVGRHEEEAGHHTQRNGVVAAPVDASSYPEGAADNVVVRCTSLDG